MVSFGTKNTPQVGFSIFLKEKTELLSVTKGYLPTPRGRQLRILPYRGGGGHLRSLPQSPFILLKTIPTSVRFELETHVEMQVRCLLSHRSPHVIARFMTLPSDDRHTLKLLSFYPESRQNSNVQYMLTRQAALLPVLSKQTPYRAFLLWCPMAITEVRNVTSVFENAF